MKKQYMKTQADCYQALLDGKTLYWEGVSTRLVNGNQETGSSISAFSFDIPENWYIKQEWYEDETNFPVICFVSDRLECTMRPKSIRAITGYNKVFNRFISDTGSFWKYAEPVDLSNFKQIKLTE